MKKYIIGIFALSLFAFTGIQAQTVDEIIKKHIDAHGGEAAWGKIDNMKITGLFTSFSEVYDFTEIITADGKFYSEHHLGQHPVTEGTNGEVIWRFDPWLSQSPIPANPAEAHTIIQKSEFCTPFYKYKERGFSVSYEGKEKMDGKEVFKLVLDRGNGITENWYLDTKTYLEYYAEGQWLDFGYPSPAEYFFEDFRKVGDIIIPFYYERMFGIRHRVTEIEEVEFNVEVEEKIFELPKSKEIQKLGFLVGDWNVAVQALSRRGGFVTTDSTTSVITYTPNKNLLTEDITYAVGATVNRINSWTYHDESQQYRVASFNDYYSVMNMFQGDFAGDSLVVSNEKIRYSEEQPQRSTRFVYKNITDNGFLVELHLSMDGGETWITRQKFTYTRQD